tara:strand:+ start:1105 stop:1542 length:438 start_codon:yes stop_codon:yes gene_type:complete
MRSKIMDKKRRGFTKEYIEFEIRYLGQLEELWYETPNDELRQVILDAREALQSIFMSRCTCASDKEITCIVHPTIDTDKIIGIHVSEIPTLVSPEYSPWKCFLFGSYGADNITYIPLKGKEPNWFWRMTQHLILGHKWVKEQDNG